MDKATVASAADRFFRGYHRHCVRPDEDSLFDQLNAIHSLNDKLKKLGKEDLFGSAPFAALRAFRNLFHHQSELLHEIKSIRVADVPNLSSDLAFVCLVRRELVDMAIGREPSSRDIISSALRWYGPVVDIEPCVFNAAVDVYESIEPLRLSLSSAAYHEFAESFDNETRQGREHHTRGEIVTAAGDVERVLSRLFASSAPPSKG